MVDGTKEAPVEKIYHELIYFNKHPKGKEKTNLASPEKYGMQNAINIHLFLPPKRDHGVLKSIKNTLASLIGWETNPFEYIGAWMIHPLAQDAVLIDVKSGAEDLIVLYLHGTGTDRSDAADVYKLIQSLGFFTLAIDYRGFGDSTQVLANEESMAEDTEFAISWLNKTYPTAKIIVWAHSLGTGVACKIGASNRQRKNKSIIAFILEAPFCTLFEAVNGLSPVNIPDFTQKVFKNLGIEFDNRNQITKIRQPIYILHAKDDKVVGFEQGKSLYKAGKKLKLHINLIEFKERLKLGHNHIHTYIFIKEIIKAIVKDAILKKGKTNYSYEGCIWHKGYKL